MDYKTAKEILKKHNLWRRGGIQEQPHFGDDIGQAIDALTAREEYGSIATELRNAALAPNYFLGDIESRFLHAFHKTNFDLLYLKCGDKKDKEHYSYFLLFVAEAITW